MPDIFIEALIMFTLVAGFALLAATVVVLCIGAPWVVAGIASLFLVCLGISWLRNL